MRYVAPGEIFGVAPAMGLKQYPATATAVDDSVVLVWPSAAWPRLVAKFPALATNTLQAVGSRLQEIFTRVVEMSTEQVEQRIAHALLRLAKQSGRKVERGVEIDFPISRQDIAQMTGTTLHTVSRILSGWEQAGWSRAAGSASCCASPTNYSFSPRPSPAKAIRRLSRSLSDDGKQRIQKCITIDTVLMTGVVHGVKARNRTANASHPEFEEHADRLRRAAHHIVNQIIESVMRIHVSVLN